MQNMLNSNKIVCEGGSDKKKKRKRKKIHECAFKNNQLTQLLHLWLQSRLNDFTAFPPLAPSGKTSGKKKKKKRKT